MPFLPGDSLLFTAGLFANQVNQTTGEPFLNIFLLLGLLFFAAVLGDNTNYWVGRKIGLRAVQIKFRNKRIVKQEYLDKTHAFFKVRHQNNYHGALCAYCQNLYTICSRHSRNEVPAFSFVRYYWRCNMDWKFDNCRLFPGTI